MADGDNNTPTTLSKVEFFKPSAITGGVSGWADWNLQSGGNPSVSRQRAQSLKQNGDEDKCVQFGMQASYTESFTAKKTAPTDASDTGGLVIPAVGVVSGGAHIDSVDVSYSQTGFPTMSVASHKHANASGVLQNHDSCRVYTKTVVLPPRAIGVPSTLKDSSGNTIFSCPSGIGMKSLKYSLKVTHTDESDGDGGHLAGQNRDGVESLSIEFTGNVVLSELAIHNSWMLPDSESDAMGNTASTTKSITITKHIGYDTVNTPTGAEN